MKQKQNIKEILNYVNNRIDFLASENRPNDQIALCKEFFEWIETDDYEIMAISVQETP